MVEKINNRLQMELGKREANTALLEGTEGFSRLTERQKRIIKNSLYIQARAGREPKSAPLTGVDRRKYSFSQDHVAFWQCFGAIINLEEEQELLKEKPDVVSKDFNAFFEAEYEKAESLEQLEERVKQFGFPAVLHCAYNTPQDPMHSCLILGENNSGEIIAWEKHGAGFPYQLITLREIYRQYNMGETTLWGLRKLRSHLSEEGQNDKIKVT